MTWKLVSPSFAGSDAQHFGGNDLNKIANLFSGVASIDNVDMNNIFKFRNTMFQLADSDNTNVYIYNTSNLTVNRNITLPALGQDDVPVFATEPATLANKTLTAPIISSISNSGTLTLPTGTDNIVARTSTDTLTNKTESSPTFTGTIAGTPIVSGAWTWNTAQTFATLTKIGLTNSIIFSNATQTANRTYTMPDAAGEVTVNSATQPLTGKTIDAASNTTKNIVQSPAVRKYGVLLSDSTGWNVSGILSSLVATSAGSRNMQNSTTAGGRYMQYDTGSTSGTRVGTYDNAGWMTYRFLNPRFKIKFALEQTTNQRFYCGLSSAANSSDTFLTTADNGVCFGVRSTDTNWQIYTNNAGSGGMTVTPYSPTTAADTAWHTIEIKLRDSTADATVQLDNGTPQVVGTNIPTSTGLLSPLIFLINTTAASKKLDQNYIEMEMD